MTKQTNLVASELKGSGFVVKQFGKKLHVSLANRKPSSLEIKQFLMRSFEGVNFKFQNTTSNVIVTLA